MSWLNFTEVKIKARLQAPLWQSSGVPTLLEQTKKQLTEPNGYDVLLGVEGLQGLYSMLLSRYKVTSKRSEAQENQERMKRKSRSIPVSSHGSRTALSLHWWMKPWHRPGDRPLLCISLGAGKHSWALSPSTGGLGERMNSFVPETQLTGKSNLKCHISWSVAGTNSGVIHFGGYY